MVMANGKNIDTYNVAAIEQRMQRLSAEGAKILGSTQKISPEKKTDKKK